MSVVAIGNQRKNVAMVVLCEHLEFLEEGVSMEDLIEHLSLKLTFIMQFLHSIRAIAPHHGLVDTPE
jgi:hypothetical protein